MAAAGLLGLNLVSRVGRFSTAGVSPAWRCPAPRRGRFAPSWASWARPASAPPPQAAPAPSPSETRGGADPGSVRTLCRCHGIYWVKGAPKSSYTPRKNGWILEHFEAIFDDRPVLCLLALYPSDHNAVYFVQEKKMRQFVYQNILKQTLTKYLGPCMHTASENLHLYFCANVQFCAWK